MNEKRKHFAKKKVLFLICGFKNSTCLHFIVLWEVKTVHTIIFFSKMVTGWMKHVVRGSFIGFVSESKYRHIDKNRLLIRTAKATNSTRYKIVFAYFVLNSNFAFNIRVIEDNIPFVPFTFIQLITLNISLSNNLNCHLLRKEEWDIIERINFILIMRYAAKQKQIYSHCNKINSWCLYSSY